LLRVTKWSAGAVAAGYRRNPLGRRRVLAGWADITAAADPPGRRGLWLGGYYRTALELSLSASSHHLLTAMAAIPAMSPGEDCLALPPPPPNPAAPPIN